MITRKLQECRARIEALESSLRVYRHSPYRAAAERVATQLDQAYLELDRAERELSVKREGLG